MKKTFKDLFSLILVAVIAIVWFATPIDRFIADAVDSRTDAAASVKQGADKKVNSTFFTDRLDERGKHTCEIIAHQLPNAPKAIFTPDIKKDELSGIFNAVSYDYPELFLINNNCRTVYLGGICLYLQTYLLTGDEYEKQLSDVRRARDEIIRGLNLPENASDYDKVLAVHDYLAENVDYHDKADTDYSPYGILVLKTGNCEGYSRAAQYLLNCLGVETHLVPGKAIDSTGKPQSHMWNVVKVNGHYYNMDVTFDDYLVSRKDSVTSSQDASHTYFLVSTDTISRTHTPDKPEFNAECKYEDINYFAQNNILFKSAADAMGSVREGVRSTIARGRGSYEMKFATEQAFNDFIDSINNSPKIYQALRSAGSDIEGIRYTTDTNYYVIRIYF